MIKNEQKSNQQVEVGVKIYTGRIARELLRKGYTIIDLKPNKEDSRLSIFVFRKDAGISEAIELAKVNTNQQHQQYKT